MQFLACIVFASFMGVWSFGYGLVYCVVCPFLNFKGRFFMAGLLTYPVFFVLKLACGLGYTVEGRENLPPGNHVILMKHSSTWETYAIMILFPPLVWVMKREILWIPFVGWGCLLARCIAIDRKGGTAAVNQVLAHGPGRDAALRLEWHFVSRAGRSHDRARGAQRRLLLAAARAAQEARHHPGGDRSAHRSGRPRCARGQ
jgi:1-acyl-sn-glycerol-3-phosphate acyltransferase